jgi:hypothetical protein
LHSFLNFYKLFFTPVIILPLSSLPLSLSLSHTHIFSFFLQGIKFSRGCLSLSEVTEGVVKSHSF